MRKVASLFSVSEKTVYRWISRQDLPAYRIHEQYRFNPLDLVEWATAHRIPVPPGIFDQPHAEAVAIPPLVDALQCGGTHYNIEAGTKEEVISRVVNTICLPEGISADFLCHLLIARENLGSTAIGDGIAIPHARMPVVLHVNQPGLSLCFLTSPVAFDAPDGKPVFALFTLISPTVRTHLAMLSRLSCVLHDADVRNLLQRRAEAPVLLEAIRLVEARLPAPGVPGKAAP